MMQITSSNGKRGKRVGLALGGGMVRGVAHIGVLDVLHRAGIKIDCIAGSSAGALIGAAYCAGWDVKKIKEISHRLTWWKIVRPVWPSKGLVTLAPIEHWFVKTFGDPLFSDLRIPFTVVATDLNTGESVTLHEGRVAPALRASCSVPGFITPVELNGRLLCDGNLSNSVPVSAVREMGADYVIGVDIFLPAMRMGWGAVGYGAAGLEILVQRAGGGIDCADCLIAPVLGGATYMRFSKRHQLYELGVQAAEAKLPDILQDLEMYP
jgi:NTE family protein